MYSNKIKAKARSLRKNGSTYGEINRKLGIPKSTLSSWFSDTSQGGTSWTREDRLKHLDSIRKLAKAEKHRRKEERIAEIQESVLEKVAGYELSRDDVQMGMLATLYWAEGSKNSGTDCVRFTNTDPKLMLMFITLFRDLFDLDESKFRLRIHRHHYHDEDEVADFWCSLLDIPRSQLSKVWEKPRSKTKKFRRNFKGICFLDYYDVALLREIMETAMQIYDNLSPNTSP